MLKELKFPVPLHFIRPRSEFSDKISKKTVPLGDFLCIPTPNTGQLNPLFHTFVEYRLIVNRVVVRQSTDWLAANAQFFPNENF